ncbi:MAG: SRPBCC family protein [Streptosporangiaceae bacterium]|nr:SRPBCC family protein [Streptosporangiaceae bacterium]
MNDPRFVYTTYIGTTSEELWRALIEPSLTRLYWGGSALESDWKAGSPIKTQWAPDMEFKDLGQRVLIAEPHRRLSYTWHLFQPEHAARFSWGDAEFSRYASEKRSKVTFEIEPSKVEVKAVRLTVIHDDFDPGSMMYQAISGGLAATGGWPAVLANAKTLLETGKPLPSAF